MRVISNASQLRSAGRKVCAAIGVFDGVHLGHQQIIRQTTSDARQQDGVSVVITFDRHPNSIVAPQRVPPSIYRVSHKLRLIENLGAHATWLIPFDRAFSEIPGETFIRDLVRDFRRLHSLCVGSAFTFGFQRGGDVNLLQKLGKELGFSVHGLAAVALDGKVVSSTRIREAIREGHLDDASQMLGRPYAVAGKVVQGDQLGRKLGFPTANIDVGGLVVPPIGVYAAWVRWKRQRYRGAINIGVRPTIDGSARGLRFEVHLLDFEGELYGEELEVQFIERIREEQKFNSLDELKSQIARDIEAVRRS